MSAKIHLAVLATLVFSSLAQGRVIYGEDHRMEVSEGSVLQQKLAKSAATLIAHNDMVRSPSKPGLVQFTQRSLREWLESSIEDNDKRKGLFSSEVSKAAGKGITFCEKERFTDQPNPGMCSGFLIAPDLIVTAGHCAEISGFCDDYSWAFDFKVDPLSKKAGLDIKEEDIYKCKKVVSTALSTPLGLDYAVVQLDRRVTGREPLDIRNDNVIENNAPVFVIGSPSGLPLKIAAGANVRDNDHPTYFKVNTDTYQGNSGSGVFNARTGVIEGILVRGDVDYVPNNLKMCVESNKCGDFGCQGEDVTRMTAVPEIGVQKVLNAAAERGDLNTVEKILKLNLWVDFYGKDGQTALIRAVSGGRINTITALLEKGADINHQDALGNASAHHLAWTLNSTSEGVLNLLIKNKADLEARNSMGETALLIAGRNLNLAGVKMLIKSGVAKNVVDNKGESVLFAFAKNGNAKAVKELIALGVDSSIKNAQGQTINDIAKLIAKK